MIRKLVFLHFLLAGICVSCANAPREVRILSYNVHACSPKGSTVADYDAIAEYIKESGADIVALQELDCRNKRHAEDQIRELASRCGMKGHFTKSIRFRGGEYGIGMLFRERPLTIDELKMQMGEHRKAVEELGDALAITASEKRVAELEHRMTQPGFYDDTEASGRVFAELSGLKGKMERYAKLVTLCDDADTMVLLCEEENDPELIPEAEAAVEQVEKGVEELQLITLLNGQYDKNNAILTFHAGTGGTEAQDWADMLFRMYNRWAAAHGFKTSTVDYQDGDEAGLKSASILVEGPNAYGLLKSENGVHRLVRVSPFDSQSRRQTSFASLEVMPELDDSIQVEIRPEDVEMQVYRSSGAGGQHINKTSSAVRLIHKPTGIVVSCQTERSQFQNRDTAMKMLASKLYQIKEQEHLDKISDIKGVQKEIAWGHQIRSYVFMPYTLVKDHRTGFENGNVQAVMDGDLDGFINAYLKAARRGELQDA